MEATALMRPEFWDDGSPLLMGYSGAFPSTLPGLVYFQTSGSAGDPKWIGLSRAALQVSAAAVNEHLGVDRDSCWTLVLPLHHVGGFGVIARSRLAGCRMERFPGRWDAADFTRWLGEVAGTHLSLVPAQVHDLVMANLEAPPALEAIVVGGGVLPEDTGRAARRLGWPVLASYGMTETGSQIATQGLDLLKKPYFTAPIELLSCWDARESDDGGIEVRGAALFSGMLRQAPDGWKYEERRGEWFKTSDLGSVDEQRRWLRIAGRADTVVKILGELVDPVAVENELLVLAGMPAGSAVVVAVPDPRAGNKLVLVHENVTDSARWRRALDIYHADCVGFRRISSVIGIGSIPKSELGKPQRAALSRFAAERVI